MTDDRIRETGTDPMTLKQGDLGLLESDVGQRLLSSRIPARLAHIATDGTPRALGSSDQIRASVR